MARYDTRLAEERGAVRSDLNWGYNDYRARYGYDSPYARRHATFWVRPDQYRGDVRAGAAYSYGVGNDYDTVYWPRHTRNNAPLRTQHGLRPVWRPDAHGTDYWASRYGVEDAYAREGGARYARDFGGRGLPDWRDADSRFGYRGPPRRYDSGYRRW